MCYRLSEERRNTESNFNVTIDFFFFLALMWLAEAVPEDCVAVIALLTARQAKIKG